MELKLEGNYSLLSTCVYNTIKDAIIAEKLEPGKKVSETGLAKELGVSRTPVREALRILYTEGFVKLTPNSSFVVSMFTQKDAIEILHVRSILESEASRMAAMNIDEEGKRKLKKAISLMDKVYELEGEEKAAEFSNADIEFHKVIFEIAGNSKMLMVSDSLHDRQIRLYISTHSANTELMDVGSRQHRHIMDAIVIGDEIGAEKYAKEHISYIKKMISSF